MNHDDIQTATASFVDFGPLARLLAALGVTLADINNLTTLIGGFVTIFYGMLKIWDWWEARNGREEERRTLKALWNKLESKTWRSRPMPLHDDEAGHDNGAGR